MQGASPEDGEVYAKMARDQLDTAQAYGEDGGGGGGALSSCANRRQQRVRADLMLCVLYDMLGRYDKSDECLDAGFEVRRVVWEGLVTYADFSKQAYMLCKA